MNLATSVTGNVGAVISNAPSALVIVPVYVSLIIRCAAGKASPV